MKRSRGLVPLVLVALLLAFGASLALPPAGRAEAPAGQLTWAVPVTLAPAWFDPADATGILTPFMILYALHDALVKPMPGKAMAPSLAESWSVSPDGLTYEFVLRQGVRFHNGDPVTADDVKFSFERYRGVSAKLLKDRVRQVQVVDPHRVRFQLKEPWPDFLTFYATPATGAAWIVPAQVRREGRRRWLQEGAGGRRAVPVRLVHPGRGAGAGGVRAVLAEEPERQAPRVQGRDRRGDAAGHAQARGSRHRLRGPGPPRRGGPAHPGPHPEAGELLRRAVGALHRSVGREVALGRPARAPGRQPRDQSPGHQPVDHPRLLAADRQHHPARLRVLLAGPALPLRAAEGEAAPDGGRVSAGVRGR